MKPGYILAALAITPILIVGAIAQSVDEIVKRTIGDQFISLTACQVQTGEKDKEIAKLKAEIEVLKPKEEGK